MRVQGPNISPFPLVDFASRVASGQPTDDSTMKRLSYLAAVPEIRKRLEDVRIFLRELNVESAPTGSEMGPSVLAGAGQNKENIESSITIGFSTTATGLEKLRPGKPYG